MESVTNYIIAWAVYLLASLVFFTLFWRFTRSSKRSLGLYCLRAVLLAMALTPWYANSQQVWLAPAIIVLLLDGITMGPGAAVRAAVPLVLAILSALTVTVVIFIATRKRSNKTLQNN